MSMQNWMGVGGLPYCNPVEDEVRSRLDEVRVSGKQEDTVRSCVGDLEEAVDSFGGDVTWHLRIFGSYATGLSTEDSDLDAICLCEGVPPEQMSRATEAFRTHLLSFVHKDSRFEIVADIVTARIPIVKLRYKNILEVDLSFQNVEPLRNTRLLRTYVQRFAGVRDFALCVKLWAKAVGVCGAPAGHLSSYSLTLMALYFMQVDPQLRMPCLPTSAFKAEDWNCPHEVKLDLKWSMREPLSVVLYRFFVFYAYEFHWGMEVVSVNIGRRTSRYDHMANDLKGCQVDRLHIVDPFLLSRNLNCVLGQHQEDHLRTRILEAAMALQNGMFPPGLQSMATLSLSKYEVVPEEIREKASHGKKQQALDKASAMGAGVGSNSENDVSTRSGSSKGEDSVSSLPGTENKGCDAGLRDREPPLPSFLPKTSLWCK